MLKVSGRFLDVLETFLLVMRDPCLEQHRVGPILSVQQWVVAVDLYKKVDAFMTFLKMGVFNPQCHWAAWTVERPT